MIKRISLNIFALAVLLTACSPQSTPSVVPANDESEATQVMVAATQLVTPTPGLQVGSSEISPKDGATLMYVPAGEFTMGSDVNADEKPIHKVTLAAFWIDQTEVTNAMYAKCVIEGGCQEPEKTSSNTRSSYYGNPLFDDYPVVYVNLVRVNAYCSWAGRRLPTEAEWEKAASWNDLTQEKYIYPWGNDKPNESLLNFNGNINDTTKVRSYESGKSFYNVYDMAGNVWEWTSSLYNPYDQKDGQGYNIADEQVIRGGSWYYIDSNPRSADRQLVHYQERTYFHVGFRCARSLP